MRDKQAGEPEPSARRRTKRGLRVVLAVAMIIIGVQHFRRPHPFESIVPNYLPAHHALVLISGLFEIAGGAGLLLPPVQRAAAWGLIALFAAVFPANINMAVHPAPGYGPAARSLLWLRLPFQFVLIAWAAWLTTKDRGPNGPDP